MARRWGLSNGFDTILNELGKDPNLMFDTLVKQAKCSLFYFETGAWETDPVLPFNDPNHLLLSMKATYNSRMFERIRDFMQLCEGKNIEIWVSVDPIFYEERFDSEAGYLRNCLDVIKDFQCFKKVFIYPEFITWADGNRHKYIYGDRDLQTFMKFGNIVRNEYGRGYGVAFDGLAIDCNAKYGYNAEYMRLTNFPWGDWATPFPPIKADPMNTMAWAGSWPPLAHLYDCPPALVSEWDLNFKGLDAQYPIPAGHLGWGWKENVVLWECRELLKTDKPFLILGGHPSAWRDHFDSYAKIYTQFPGVFEEPIIATGSVEVQVQGVKADDMVTVKLRR